MEHIDTVEGRQKLKDELVDKDNGENVSLVSDSRLRKNIHHFEHVETATLNHNYRDRHMHGRLVIFCTWISQRLQRFKLYRQFTVLYKFDQYDSKNMIFDQS